MKYTKAIRVNLETNWLLEKIPSTEFWRVWKEFHWLVDYFDVSTRIIIEEGFITDFWSIPKFMRWFFDPTKYLAYILHDYMYRKESRHTRYDADISLLQALGIEWMGIFKRRIIFWTVRTFWGLFYKKKTWK